MSFDDDNIPNVPASGDGAPAGTEKQSDESTETETEDGEESDGSETEQSTDEGDDNADGDDGNDDGEDDGEDGDEPAKPKKTSRSERYRRQAERLKAQLAQIQSSPSRGGAQPDDAAIDAEVERQIGKKPELKDYDGDYIEHERAIAAWNVDKRLTTREVKKDFGNRAKANADAFSELIDDHKERVSKFSAKVKDFKEVITAASKAGATATPIVESLVLESDKSAHLVYYLAKNPNVIEKLNGMGERAAAREIGRIEAKLSLPQPKKQTQAPKPVAPVKGGAAPASQDAGLDAYLARTYGKK